MKHSCVRVSKSVFCSKYLSGISIGVINTYLLAIDNGTLAGGHILASTNAVRCIKRKQVNLDCDHFERKINIIITKIFAFSAIIFAFFTRK